MIPAVAWSLLRKSLVVTRGAETARMSGYEGVEDPIRAGRKGSPRASMRMREQAVRQGLEAAEYASKLSEKPGKSVEGIRINSLTHDEDGVPVKWLRLVCGGPVRGGLSKKV